MHHYIKNMVAILPYLWSILALGAIFCFFSLFFYLFKPNNGLPRSYPLIGMAPVLLANYNHLYDMACDILGKTKGTFLIKGLWFTNTDMLITSDPKNIHYIATTNFNNYPKGEDSKEIFDIFENSLFTFDFEEWSCYRKSLHDYLKQPRFHAFMNKVVDNVNERFHLVLQHVAEQGMVVDMSDLFTRHLLDSAWLLCTGYELNILSVDFPENPFAKAIDDACQAMHYRYLFLPIMWKLQRLLGLGSEKKLHNAKKITQEFVQKFLSKRKEVIMKKAVDDEDCYDALKFMLLDPVEANEERYEQVVRDSIIGLIFAMYETSSTSLSWLFWLLSKNPDVEAKLRQEIIGTSFQVSKCKKWEGGSKQELSKLVYLHSVICESLRLYPPVPFNPRRAIEADVLPSGHHVAPKTRVVLSGYSVGRMKSIWGDDCLEFKPERWIDKNGNFKYETSAKFYMFNAGPRICPGKDIAFTLLKATVATIICNFHIEVVETEPPIPKASIVLQMKYGMKARVKMLA